MSILMDLLVTGVHVIFGSLFMSWAIEYFKEQKYFRFGFFALTSLINIVDLIQYALVT